MTSLRRTKLDVAEGEEEVQKEEAEVVPVAEVPEEHLEDLEAVAEVELVVAVECLVEVVAEDVSLIVFFFWIILVLFKEFP